MYKAVKSCGRIVEFAKQDEKTLMRWAAGILAKEGRKIRPGDMELFLTKTGTDMGNIRMELEKADHIHDGKRCCHGGRHRRNLYDTDRKQNF